MSVNNKILANFSKISYVDPDPLKRNYGYELPHGWSYLTSSGLKNDDLGYFGIAFKKGDDVVIAHRGTESPIDENTLRAWIEFIGDAINDYMLLRGKDFPQYHSALNFYNDVVNNHIKTENVIHTGHSLGGAIAQLVSIHTGSKSVSFDAPGVLRIAKKLFTQQEIAESNIEAYASGVNMINTAGKQIVNPTGLVMDCTDDCHSYIKYTLNTHSIDNIVNQFDDDGHPYSIFYKDSWPNFAHGILIYQTEQRFDVGYEL